MGSNLVTDVRPTIIHVCSGRGKQLRRRSTREGEKSQDLTGSFIPRGMTLTKFGCSVGFRFVEMLESHHSLVVKALQRLYKLCINKDDFPGEPLAEAPDGYPLTHAILDRLGLIKQAEENPEEPEEDTEDLQYLRLLSTSTGCSPTTDPSPEPATPPEPSSSNCSPTRLSPKSGASWKWDYQPLQPVNPYPNYQSFHGMAARSNLMSAPAETKPEHVHSVSDPDQPYFCYIDNNDTGELMKSRLPSGITAEPGSHHMQAPSGMSADILGDYNLHLHESHQPVYSGIAPGWNFPCG